MSVIGDPLFMRRDHGSVSDIIRHIESQLSRSVDEYDERKFDSQTDDQVAQALTRDLMVQPITLDTDNAKKSVDEVRITVRDVFGDTVVVPGMRVTKTFPFTGDPDLWGWGTGQWGSMMPRGEVNNRSITIGMEVRQSEGETAANHINSTVGQINEYLARQKEQLDPFNAALPGRLMPLIKARRDRRKGAESLLDKF